MAGELLGVTVVAVDEAVETVVVGEVVNVPLATLVVVVVVVVAGVVGVVVVVVGVVGEVGNIHALNGEQDSQPLFKQHGVVAPGA